MSNKKDREDEPEQSTQAIAQQPQEEFISPTNVPSKDVSEVRQTPPMKERERPRQ